MAQLVPAPVCCVEARPFEPPRRYHSIHHSHPGASARPHFIRGDTMKMHVYGPCGQDCPTVLIIHPMLPSASSPPINPQKRKQHHNSINLNILLILITPLTTLVNAHRARRHPANKLIQSYRNVTPNIRTQINISNIQRKKSNN